MEETIGFFTADIDFQLDNKVELGLWIQEIVHQAEREIDSLAYIFCTDPYLLELNKTHLDHDYFTDILTFPYSDPSAKRIESEIYISIDRVRDNAGSMQISFIDELHRVMIHGILHLLGHDDHGDQAQESMRTLEDQALRARSWV